MNPVGLVLWRHDLAPSLRVLREWYCRVQSRRDVAKIDPCTFRDLGVSASQMQFEAQKPFWRA